MNTIETTAENFRRDAIPRLAVACRFHALRVARGRETVETAATAIWRIAAELGADGLPAPRVSDLRFWLAARIAREADRVRAAAVRGGRW